ncbi:RloB family protein [Methylocystis sp. WRRC1]|uniref:RloB family protein n=1 Tax=Methylocystis sp. WRRC1 TaxID=1732014 RepID=UPI001D159807|nr:RloB family protein [Methylocystis sp. WRRC1]MCC3243719.1 RloB family protein [Methylocystis sp. WRRC1]
MRKFKSLKRVVGKRPTKIKFYIYTEGANTEPEYFRHLASSNKGTLVGIQIVPAAGVPLTIATKACAHAKDLVRAAKRDSALKNDKVWAVFDQDEHPGVREALGMCRSAGVGTAFSNPCFELWLILHYEDFDKPDDRHQVQRYLEGLCDAYDRKRAKTADFEMLVTKVREAEARARSQYERRNTEGELSRPYTTVFQLTEAIRDASASHEEAIKNV